MSSYSRRGGRERDWEKDRDRGSRRERSPRGSRRSRSRSRSPRARSERDQNPRGRHEYDRNRGSYRDRRDGDRNKDRDRDRDRDRDHGRRHDEGRSKDRRDDRRVDVKRDEGLMKVESRKNHEPDFKNTSQPIETQPDFEEGQELEPMDSVDPDEDAIAQMMGFGGFGTTKGKEVGGNQEGAALVKKQRTWRQYMNRRGGFNRPLDKIK